VTSATPAGPSTLACRGTVEAAGHLQPVEFTALVEQASEQAATLRTELEIDRTGFDMTWSPLGMAAKEARATVLARFLHA
jgi:polyisoprenoid-binding protein YceI